MMDAVTIRPRRDLARTAGAARGVAAVAVLLGLLTGCSARPAGQDAGPGDRRALRSDEAIIVDACRASYPGDAAAAAQCLRHAGLDPDAVPPPE